MSDVDSDRRRLVERVFREALELEGTEQDDFVHRACGGDPWLESEVTLLLRSHESAMAQDLPGSAGGSTRDLPGLARVSADGPTADVPEGRFDGALEDLEDEALEAFDLEPGDTVGPYRLARVLGEGGFGRVFLAEQERPLHRKVALKILKLGMSTREILARFEAERQALALLNHRGIAKVHDAGATREGRSYFVMEYVEGEPLTAYSDRKRLSTRRRLDLFLDVCDAIQHAHQKGIIHRDLKPSNILVAEEDGKPVPKVIDFGIAKAAAEPLTEESLHTMRGQIMGTLEYMSPEQTGLGGLDVDTRTDIFSLGVILYELLTGVLPLESKKLRSSGLAEALRILREEDPPTPSTRISRLESPGESAELRAAEPAAVRREIRGDLDWITMKALAKDRDRRYASVSELSADIRRHLRHEPVLARPPSLRYRLGKFLRRHRVGAAVSCAVVGLLAVVLAASAVRSRMERRGLDGELQAAVSGGDLEAARAKSAVLEERYPRSREAAEARIAVTRLEEAVAVAGSERLRKEAADLWKRHLELKGQVDELQAAWEAERERPPSWRREWERGVELARWKKLTETREGIEDLFNRAVLTLHRAREAAPKGSAEERNVRRALDDMYFARLQEAETGASVSLGPGFLRRMLAEYGAGTYARELEGRGKVSLKSEPPGAEVHCFRYVEHGARLLPLAFRPAPGLEDPAGGIAGKPALIVERVAEAAGSPFVPGDRLSSVNGVDVGSLTELAGVLGGLDRGQRVEARVRRGGAETSLEWAPFPDRGPPGDPSHAGDPGRPADRPRLVDPRTQLGLLFAGYPLEIEEASRIGVTGDTEPLDVELPRGSYLFVLRKEGHEDARYPVAIPREEGVETVRLLRREEIPEGFVYIPAGLVGTGGDPQAFQSYPWGSHRVEGFFMSRLEVTLGEYFEFLNDPEVLRRTRADGKLEKPAAEAVLQEIERAKIGGARIDGVTLFFSNSLPEREGERGPWRIPADQDLRTAAGGICQLAAIEYAHWRSEKAAREGKPWRYRIPTDLEWERAARGEDRRIFVWGNYRVWSFAWSRPGIPRGLPGPVGVSPPDESVFGVRDLIGSQSEHTTGRPDPYRPAYTAYRGGSWNQTDEAAYFRIASRNGLLPENPLRHSGIRLVADLGP